MFCAKYLQIVIIALARTWFIYFELIIVEKGLGYNSSLQVFMLIATDVCLRYKTSPPVSQTSKTIFLFPIYSRCPCPYIYNMECKWYNHNWKCGSGSCLFICLKYLFKNEILKQSFPKSVLMFHILLEKVK